MQRQVRHLGTVPGPDEGPSDAELAAIEAEWPLIEAELDLLDAEVVALVTRDEASVLAWRRLRRAQRRVLVTRGGGARARGVSGEGVA